MDLNLKNVRIMFFSFLILFPKCARTDNELFLSRIEVISFFSLLKNYFIAELCAPKACARSPIAKRFW